jgi:hypothetical protein
MNKLNVFVGKFVGGQADMAVIGEELGLYKSVAPCMRAKGVTTTSGNRVTVWQKRYQSLVLRQQLIAASVLSCLLLAPSLSFSSTPNNEDRVAWELSSLGKRGEAISRAREEVLDILQHGNACSAWFQEADPDAAGVFRSVHFGLELQGTSYVYGTTNSEREQLFKHPWGAKTIENGGRSSIIQLNGNGPFFNRTSRIVQLDPGGMLTWPGGNLRLTISSYNGGTPEAQITILLHELGHIIGRLPADGDSWDGRSSRNTSEVSRHCRSETRAAAHNGSRGRTAIPAFDPVHHCLKIQKNSNH